MKPTFRRRDFLALSALSAIELTLPCPLLASPAEFRPPRFLKQWGKHGKAEGEFDVPIALALNRRNEVFVTDFRNNRVQKFDSDGALLAVYPVVEQPGGIAFAPNGRFYVSHLMPGKITAYNADGKPIGEWGKPGEGEGEFRQPGGIVVAHDSTVYVADQVNRRVQRFTPDGKFLSQWGRYGLGPGQFGGNENPAARTGGPQFLALDRRGNVYTTEASVGRIQKFTGEGTYLLSWGSNSTEPGGFGGRPRNLPGPIGICMDRQNRVWVSATNHRIQRFTTEGVYLGGFGVEGNAPGEFKTPHGLAVDTRGNLYICDTQNARIQKFAILG